MKEWTLTLALAAGALAAFYTLMLQPAAEPPKVARPLTTEPGPNGYLGVVQWLRGQKLVPILWRERFTQLESLPGARRGNLLISTMPHVYPLRNSEFAPLRRWIEAGNTLLLVASLSDSPEWAASEEIVKLKSDLQRITGLKLVAQKAVSETSDSPPPDSTLRRLADRIATPAAPPRIIELVPNEMHPLLERVERVQAEARLKSMGWRFELAETPLALELASSVQNELPVLWLARAGRGQIIISGYGSVFTNGVLGKADNARLLANIVRWSVEEGGRILFDDAHQGAVNYYDPDAFFGDSRLHYTLWWLLVLWLVFVLGPQRLRPAAVDWRPADLTAFVRAIGGFTARVLRPAAAARQMFSLFFAEVHRRTGLPAQSEPPWEWLQAHSGADIDELARLRQLHEAAQRDRPVNLQHLHNLLARVRSSWLQH